MYFFSYSLSYRAEIILNTQYFIAAIVYLKSPFSKKTNTTDQEATYRINLDGTGGVVERPLEGVGRGEGVHLAQHRGRLLQRRADEAHLALAA